MPATLTTVAGILKEVYEGDVTDQLQEEQVAMKRIENSSDGVFEDAGGKYVRFPIRTGRNHGISYRGEMVQMAGAGEQAYLQSQETLRYGYGRVRLSGQVMGLAKTNIQAFTNAMDQEIEGLKQDVARDNNRIAWGHPLGYTTTGGTGVISRLTATTTASTTVTAPLNNVIEPRMVIDIVDNTGTPLAGCTGLIVASVASNELSFTTTVSCTAASGSWIVRTGNWNQEPYGLSALYAGSGTLHGINPAVAGNETWKAAEDDNVTTTLTEPFMIKMCDSIRRKGGDKPTIVFMSLGVRRSYYNLMTSMRRYNEPTEWEGGLVGLKFNYGKSIPVVEDIDAPANSMYILNEKQIKIYSNENWHFDDSDGNMLKWIPGFDGYEAYYKRYWQLVTHKRNSGARATNLVEA